MLTTSLSPLALVLGLSATARAGTKYMGVAISGIDFDCTIEGACPYDDVEVPLASLGGADSAAQMAHFVEDDGLNMFRLPVTWQFLLDGTTIGTLSTDRLKNYDSLMQACLTTGAYCMIDLHNFARFEGEIIGQGGPTNDDFADLWSQLATMYANESKVVFELMNEPHDLDIDTWADTCQAAVTAIREAGATTQMILLPGTYFDSAETLTTDGSAAALFAITNPDGTTDNLHLDIHKYLDINNSGTLAECVTDNVGNFTRVATYLRKENRLGLISETGASSDSSCMTLFRAQNEYINANSDVFLGIIGWAAGNFDGDYLLSLTPSLVDGKYVDNDIMTECLLEPWKNSTSSSSASSSVSSSASSSASSSVASSTTSSTSKKTSSTASAASSTAVKVSNSTATATVAATTTTGTSLSNNAGSAEASATTSASSGAAAWTMPLLSGVFAALVAVVALQ